MDMLLLEYTFLLPCGRREEFVIRIDPVSLVIEDFTSGALPAWTHLAFHQCPNCPLTPADAPQCPAAAVLVPVVQRFEGLVSHDEVSLEVVSNERRIMQKTTAQRAIGSMVGLLLATSGCPRTAFFKPMARFHLPLASEDETVYRAASMYILAQYFRHRDRGGADFELDGLAAIYKNIQVVNAAIAQRLRAATETDSSVNAIILLDMYAKAMPYVIRDKLEELGHLFAAYFEDSL